MKDGLQLKAAFAIYMGARPFTLLDDRYFRQYLSSLSGYFNYIPPSHSELAGGLLQKAYELVHREVLLMLENEDYLNIVMDESGDIADRHIINMCIVTPIGAFYYETEDSKDESQTAQMLFEWMMKKVQALVGKGGWWRFNSFITDTCNTMRAVWSLVQRDPRTKHVFCIPCNSHGLQLLIHDLLDIEPYSTLLEKAQTIAQFFRRAKLQYAILRKHQHTHFGRSKAFVLAVSTQWGTQAGLIGSVLDNKRPLISYLNDENAEPAPDVKSIIRQTPFWACLDDLYTLLGGISERQKMSESTHAHIGQVHQCWIEVHEHIRVTTMEVGTFQLKPEATARLLPAFSARHQKQNVPIHLVAYFLDPSSIQSEQIPTSEQNEVIIAFLKRYGSDMARQQYGQFRSQQGYFSVTGSVWELAGSARAFWQEVSIFAPELARLALGIFYTPSNSVSSERSFSTRNLIHDKKRNRLDAKRADKLSFVHINKRILDRQPSDIRGWLDRRLKDEDLVEYEEDCIVDDACEEEPGWIHDFIARSSGG